jgi:hypothetical protein
MTRYVRNEKIVDAFVILSIGPVQDDGKRSLALDNGENRLWSDDPILEAIPECLDYLLFIQEEDGCEYIITKNVFYDRYTHIFKSSILNGIDIGELSIRLDRVGNDDIWIRRNGEGGNFNRRAFSDHVLKFFNDNF